MDYVGRDEGESTSKEVGEWRTKKKLSAAEGHREEVFELALRPCCFFELEFISASLHESSESQSPEMQAAGDVT